jgi:hypothetical protein
MVFIGYMGIEKQKDSSISVYPLQHAGKPKTYG